MFRWYQSQVYKILDVLMGCERSIHLKKVLVYLVLLINGIFLAEIACRFVDSALYNYEKILSVRVDFNYNR